MFNNISDLLKYQSKKIPLHSYLNDFDKSYSFQEFNSLVNRCCNLFQNLKLNKGDVISICLYNKIEFLILYFACIRFGAIFYLISTNDSEVDLIKKLNFVNSKIIFIDNENSYKQIIKENNSFFVDKFFMKELNNYEDNYDNQKILDHDIAGYYSSSGTTNESKTICYTNKNMISGIYAVYESNLFKNVKKHLCFLPFFHTSALRYSIKSSLINGSEVFIVKNFWSIKDKIWNIVKDLNINFFQMVPSIVNIILKNPNTNKTNDLSKIIHFCGCGSSFLPQEQQEEFENKFNVKLLNLYGLSEIGASHFEDPLKRKIGSIGKPFKRYDVKILNSKYEECKPLEPGQISVKGDPVFKTYLKKDVNNVFKNGYFLTGDYGYRDSDDYFFFIDRTKDLIIKGGTNISPNEIDKIINKFEGIIESATIPINNEFYGEVPYTFLVLDNNFNFDINELIIYCKKNLGEFKTPIDFEIVKEIPKGPSGKILKRLLKKNDKK